MNDDKMSNQEKGLSVVKKNPKNHKVGILKGKTAEEVREYKKEVALKNLKKAKEGKGDLSDRPQDINRIGLNRRYFPTMMEIMSKIPKQNLEKMVNNMVKKAIKGDVQAANLILDRMYGKAVQRVNTQSSNPVININHKVIDADDAKLADD
jgi:hypothetical protein